MILNFKLFLKVPRFCGATIQATAWGKEKAEQPSHSYFPRSMFNFYVHVSVHMYMCVFFFSLVAWFEWWWVRRTLLLKKKNLTITSLKDWFKCNQNPKHVKWIYGTNSTFDEKEGMISMLKDRWYLAGVQFYFIHFSIIIKSSYIANYEIIYGKV